MVVVTNIVEVRVACGGVTTMVVCLRLLVTLEVQVDVMVVKEVMLLRP